MRSNKANQRSGATIHGRGSAPAAAPTVVVDGANPQIERVLFDHISDAVFATDPDNRVTYWSASAARLFGYPAREAVGRPFG